MADPRNLCAYVSAYQPDRTHVVRLSRGEKVTLSADFNGAIASDLTIASVIWRCLNPWAVKMEDAAIEGRKSSVSIATQWGCGASLKCEATLSDGSVVTQLFRIHVRTGPWFFLEPTGYTSGPYDLTATA